MGEMVNAIVEFFFYKFISNYCWLLEELFTLIYLMVLVN